VATTNRIYGKAFLSAFNAEVDLDTNTIKVALADSGEVPDQDADDYFNDVTNEEAGTGYTAGGATLASKTVTYTGGTNVFAFDAADATWTTSTITTRNAIVYKDTGTASTSPLLTYHAESADVSTTAGTFTFQIASAGIFTVTPA